MSATSETPQVQGDGVEGEAGSGRMTRVRRVVTTFGYALASLGDVGLLVAGGALVALAISILLDGFNVVPMDLTDSTGAMLGSAMVIAVFGGFGMGVAFEGPVGHGRLLSLVDLLELTLARLVAALLVGFGMTALGSFLSGYTSELPYPFELAADVIAACGRAGLILVPLVAVPATFLLRWRFPGERWMEEAEFPVLYLVWLLGAMFFVIGVL